MAATATISTLGPGKTVYTVTLTAQNDVYVFGTRRPSQITMQGEGISASDLTMQASNNGSDWYALPTATSLAADGLKSVATADLGYAYYRIIEETASESVTATVIVTEQR